MNNLPLLPFGDEPSGDEVSLFDRGSNSKLSDFADSSILCKTEETRKGVIDLERRVGFRRFCINTEIDSIWRRVAGKKKKDEGRESPQPQVPPPGDSPEREGCRFYSRLTFPITDPIQLNKMASSVAMNYDVVAVEPNDEKIFHKICSDAETVDLLTFNYGAGNAPAFKLNHNIVKVAISRGLHFEICISPGLRSSTNAKQNLITFARKIISVTKGKNVILSLGAAKPNEVRGPYDLMNLGVLFGMNQSQAKDAVTKNFDAVLRHGLTRKSGGGAVTIQRSVDCGAKTKAQMERLRKIKDRMKMETKKIVAAENEHMPSNFDAEQKGNESSKDEKETNRDSSVDPARVVQRQPCETSKTDDKMAEENVTPLSSASVKESALEVNPRSSSRNGRTDCVENESRDATAKRNSICEKRKSNSDELEMKKKRVCLS